MDSVGGGRRHSVGPRCVIVLLADGPHPNIARSQMSFERSVPPPPAEPAPPTATTAGPTTALSEGTTAAMRLQILSTEHWSLLATRSLAWSEVFNRAGMFLSALSGAIVALALVAQASHFGEGFKLFALVILPVVLFVGVTTYIRLGAANWYDANCIIGMNRIRAAYLQMAPDLEPYFVTSAHDDRQGVGITMGLQPAASQTLHLFAATPIVVATLNSVIAAAIAAVIALHLKVDTSGALALAVVTFLVSMALHLTYGRRNIARGQATLRPMFPTPPGP
jgi:hypothetical protein